MLKNTVLITLFTGLIISLAACSTSPGGNTRGGPELPVFEVVKGTHDANQIQQLLNDLGIEVEVQQAEGAVNFTDPDNFAFIPTNVVDEGQSEEDEGETIVETIDVDALAKLPEIADKDMASYQEALTKALNNSDLFPQEAFNPQSIIAGHSNFAMFDLKGGDMLNVDLDTHIVLETSVKTELGNIPFEGAGAEIKAVFDRQGRATQVFFGRYELEQVGTVKIIPPDNAAKLCQETFKGITFDRGRVVPLVYMVPEFAEQGQQIQPAYACGSRDAKEGSDLVRTVYVDAVDGTPLVVSKGEIPSDVHPQSLSSSFSPQVGGRIDVASEWIGLTQGLGGSQDNAGGFISMMRDKGYHISFNFGDNAAWERDFKDSSTAATGLDSTYVDNVDMLFYTGHAGATNFTFNGNDDGSLHYTDNPRWGNKDLEWLVIAACGPLQLNSAADGNVAVRWGRSFSGLHMMLAYANVSGDNTVEGNKLATKLLGTQQQIWFITIGDAPKKVRTAWIETATEVQPSSVTWALMGPIGSGDISNYNDYFHGKGSVSGDIRSPVAYWYLAGPS